MPSQQRLWLRRNGRHHGDSRWWIMQFYAWGKICSAFEMLTPPKHSKGETEHA